MARRSVGDLRPTRRAASSRFKKGRELTSEGLTSDSDIAANLIAEFCAVPAALLTSGDDALWPFGVGPVAPSDSRTSVYGFIPQVHGRAETFYRRRTVGRWWLQYWLQSRSRSTRPETRKHHYQALFMGSAEGGS